MCFQSCLCVCVCVCVCLSVCHVCALTCEILDVQTSFLVCRYIFRISGPSSYVSGQGHRSKSGHTGLATHISVGGPPLIEGHCCLLTVSVKLYLSSWCVCCGETKQTRETQRQYRTHSQRTSHTLILFAISVPKIIKIS